MKKILFVHHAVGWGGAPKNMVEIIKSLNNDLYESKVLLLKDSNVSGYLRAEGIKYRVASSIFYKRFYRYFGHTDPGHVRFYQLFKLLIQSVSWLLSRYYFAKRELLEEECDIVQLNSSVLTDWLASAKSIGKTIIHIQEPFKKGKLDCLHVFFKFQMKKYADSIIAISNDNANRINLQEKTTVIYNYSQLSSKIPSLDSYKSMKVLYLGGAAYIKGFFTVVKALKIIDPSVKVYFAGYYDKVGRDRFLNNILLVFSKRKRALRKMRSYNNAIEIGLIDNVDKYIDEVCCVISPFTVPHFSRPIIEAQLRRKPAICSDVRGMDEIVNDGITGLIVPRNNPVELAKAINYLTFNFNAAKELGESAYKDALLRFTADNILKFEVVYRSLIQNSETENS